MKVRFASFVFGPLLLVLTRRDVDLPKKCAQLATGERTGRLAMV